jgi:hypothetical protein
MPEHSITLPARDWRTIAELASKELNPQKLTVLVAQLCVALDQERQSKSASRNAGTVLSGFPTHD